MRKPDLSVADKLSAAYEAKARAELADADAVLGAAPGTWDGPVVGARIAFLRAHPDGSGAGAALLPERVADAVVKAAQAMGAGEATFVMVTRPTAGASVEDRALRLRIAIEAVDAPAVIALDTESAEDLAAAFGLDHLRPGTPVRALGRSLGSVGDFVASLDDDAAKVRAWSAMKAVAAQAGLKAKERQKTPREGHPDPAAPDDSKEARA